MYQRGCENKYRQYLVFSFVKTNEIKNRLTLNILKSISGKNRLLRSTQGTRCYSGNNY